MLIVRFSIQPSSPSRRMNAPSQWFQPADAEPRMPMVGSLSACCADAARGPAAAAPPNSVMNSRRFIADHTPMPPKRP
jgi:hypothetical protein